ncbi:MAG: class I tRNA ligase family protein, partial [Deltaproteobacteria bacterium]|nr:class I tRNA ligase family protein [Deltaproteobacteria bacterium]
QQAHQALKKVTEDYGQFKYNTLLAALMTLRNQMKQARKAAEGTPEWNEALDLLLLMLAPICPFITEELWQRRHGGASVHRQSWPAFDPELARPPSVTLVVQINGKFRERMEISADTPPESLEAMALELPRVADALKGKTVRKAIVVGNKLVNILAG